MIEASFHTPSSVPNDKLKYAVIAARYRGKWIFCRHKSRSTWDIPGGHREPGESIIQAAYHELLEETGAVRAELHPLTVYAVRKDGEASYGMLYLAEVDALSPLSPAVEIGEIRFSDSLPWELTYPLIQPHLFRFAEKNITS